MGVFFFFGGGGGGGGGNFKYFLGCVKFLIFLGGEWSMLGPSLRMKKK